MPVVWWPSPTPRLRSPEGGRARSRLRLLASRARSPCGAWRTSRDRPWRSGGVGCPQYKASGPHHASRRRTGIAIRNASRLVRRIRPVGPTSPCGVGSPQQALASFSKVVNIERAPWVARPSVPADRVGSDHRREYGVRSDDGSQPRCRRRRSENQRPTRNPCRLPVSTRHGEFFPSPGKPATRRVGPIRPLDDRRPDSANPSIAAAALTGQMHATPSGRSGGLSDHCASVRRAGHSHPRADE